MLPVCECVCARRQANGVKLILNATKSNIASANKRILNSMGAAHDNTDGPTKDGRESRLSHLFAERPCLGPLTGSRRGPKQMGASHATARI